MTEYNIIRDIKTLATPCVNFDFTNPPIDPQELSTDLMREMNKYNGIGLAANQIGLPYRVFCMRGDPENHVCFNPRIVMPSSEYIMLEEGCLSFPGLVVKISRPKHIRVRFETPSGQTVTEQLTGLTARCFQHELDHLDGVLFYNRSSHLVRERAIKKMRKNEKLNKQTIFSQDLFNVNSAEFDWNKQH